MLYDVPDDDTAAAAAATDSKDGDGVIDHFTVECSQRPFPSIYYLQLDSDTK